MHAVNVPLRDSELSLTSYSFSARDAKRAIPAALQRVLSAESALFTPPGSGERRPCRSLPAGGRSGAGYS